MVECSDKQLKNKLDALENELKSLLNSSPVKDPKLSQARSLTRVVSERLLKSGIKTHPWICLAVCFGGGTLLARSLTLKNGESRMPAKHLFEMLLSYGAGFLRTELASIFSESLLDKDSSSISRKIYNSPNGSTVNPPLA